MADKWKKIFNILCRRESIGTQFFRFSLVGVLNTTLDFLVLNVLILTIGLGETVTRYVIFTVIAVLISFTNSFFWNKNWTFKIDVPVKNMKKAFFLFFLIAGLGLVWNVITATAVYALLEHLYPDIPGIISANTGALCALIVVVIWDFLGYKYVVFKK